MLFERIVVTLATASLPLGVMAVVDVTDAEVRSEVRSAGLRALLDLRVNGSAKGQILVVLEGGDALVAVADLEAGGLQGIGGRRSELEGTEYVSLRSLAPQLAFTVDERALRLDVTARAELLGRGLIDLGNVRPQGMISRGEPSAYANYAVRADRDLHTSLSAEAGVGSGNSRLYSGLSVPYGGVVTRGLTVASIEEPPVLRRWVAGDAAIGLGGLGSTVVVGGLGVARDFSLDPYVSYAPRPSSSAFVASPSTLEVYVNGTLVRRQQVQPGTIDLTNFPVREGTNDVRLVLRDAYGREQSFDERAVFCPGLLARGHSDYAYHLGFVREDLTSSFRYGPFAALARHRFGLTDLFTVGYRLEGALDRGTVGSSVTFGTWIGTFDLELAGSVQRGRPGGAGSGIWSWSSRKTTAGVRLRGASRQYGTVALDHSEDRSLFDGTAFLALRPIPRLGVSLDFVASRRRDAGDTLSVTARVDLGITKGLSVMLATTGALLEGTPNVSGLLLLSWAIGRNSSAHALGRVGKSDERVLVGAQRTLPMGPGYGYRAEVGSSRADRQALAEVQGQTQFGRYGALLEQIGDRTEGELTVSGGAVVLGGRAFLTRPVEGSFGLMRVGVPEVRGYLEAQEIGRTDDRGDLLVPALLPRYGNRLGIEVRDIPMEYEVGKVQQLLAPPLKVGGVADFEVKPIRAFLGRVEVETAGPPEIPAYGEIRLTGPDGSASRTATGSDGLFFVERAVPGTYLGEVSWSGRTCDLRFEVPDRIGMADLGTLRCIIRRAAARD